MKLFFTTVGLLFLPALIYAQKVRGRITDSALNPLSGVSVYWMKSQVGVTTDTTGMFDIEYPLTEKPKLIVRYTGYQSDTFQPIRGAYLDIIMRDMNALSMVTITGQNNSSSYIDMQTIKTEVITQGELKKAACCDLAGCFETQGTVQPMVTNILTNAKELRILGLSGVYNQILFDGLPMIQGLTYTYGISSVPGTLVDNIFVAKGTTSVLQGFESMVGQINLVTKNPDKGERILLNVYLNSFGENHYNLNFRTGVKKWNNLTAFQWVRPASKWDRDHDLFMDLPQLNRYMVFNKLKYGDETKNGLCALLTVRYVNESRIGGQMHYNPEKDKGSTFVYGQQVRLSQPEFQLKSFYKLSTGKRIALMASGFSQQQNSWFGTVKYLANQHNFYGNVQYELMWNRVQELKTGISYRYMKLDEQIDFTDTVLKRSYDGTYLKNEHIPGLFAENTFHWRADILTLITGMRADYHNKYGWFITPRAMLKYDLSEMSTLRVSAGNGWRTLNLFSENIGLLTSSRNILFSESLQPEKAFNWGLNYLKRFKQKQVEGFITFDFYQTRFQNQIFPDYDREPSKAIVGNFTGTSVSNGFQTDLNCKLYKTWELKAAYNFLNVYRLVNSFKTMLPFNARHKVLTAVSYVPKTKKWRADINAHWFGKQRLPDSKNNPVEFRQDSESKSFTTFNIQLTKGWKKIEAYGGCENLLDYRQLRPIVSWQNPFSPYFDTSFNWGPTRGREWYVGLRLKL